MRTRWILFAATLSIWAAAPASSQAAVQFQAEGPPTLSLPGTQIVNYSLRMVSGADPEEFSVGVKLPVLRGPDGGAGGLALLQRGFPFLQGPGALGQALSSAHGGEPEQGRATCRGYPSSSKVTMDVSLPPFSDTRMMFVFEVFRGFGPAFEFPLVGDSYTPSFVVSSDLVGSGAGTTGPTRLVTPPAPTFSPPLGPHVEFQTQPAITGIFPRRGVRYRFTGSTSPAAPNQVIRISYRYQFGYDDVRGTIGETRTDALGRYRWPEAANTKRKATKKKGMKKKGQRKRNAGWKPHRLGTYHLTAELVPQSSDIGPSRSCGKTVNLKK